MVTVDLQSIDWSAVNTESLGQYTVMFGRKPVKITVETDGSDGEVSGHPVETSSKKDCSIEMDQFEDKTTEDDETNFDSVEKGKQRLIELNNVSIGDDISISDTEKEHNTNSEYGIVNDGQSNNEKDSGVESDGALKEGNEDDKKDDGCSEMAKWDMLTSEHSSDEADIENEKDTVHVKTEKVDGAFCPKLTSYFKIRVICTNIVKMFVLC